MAQGTDSKNGPGEPEPKRPYEPADNYRPKNPRRKAKYNFISRLYLIWLEPFFVTGCRRELTQKDLYAHPGEADSKKLLHRFNGFWLSELERKRSGRKARLWVALLKCIWWRMLVQAILVFIVFAVWLGQSLVLGELTDYFTFEQPTAEQTRDAYLYAFGLFLMSIVFTLMQGHAFLTGLKVGMLVRIIVTSAIYQKVARLSQVTIGKLSIGHIVNLSSNDVQRFDKAFLFIHFIWIGPIHLSLVTYLLYRLVGYSALTVTVLTLLIIPTLFALAKTFQRLRLKSARLTDQRVKVMNEVITGIRVIKMYAWEHAFRKIVTGLRRVESKLILAGNLIQSCIYGLLTIYHLIVLFVMYSVFTSTGGLISAKSVATALSLLLVLRATSLFLFVSGVISLSDGSVALKRIQNFLELDEIHNVVADHTYFKLSAEDSDTPLTVASKQQQIPGVTNPVVTLEGYFRPESPWLPGSSVIRRSPSPPVITPANLPFARVDRLSASWSNDREKMVLKDISFEVLKHKVMAVIGPVGVGKSTLLQCLLGELKGMDGSVEVNGRVSYASQDPWVFSDTVRENILFGRPYKELWYHAVLVACALDKDVAQLIDGDLTMVGERGVTLSGGQKARVNLARAVYRDADVYLLDDPLSAVDTAVAKHLFDKCIRGLLRDRVVILVTHQLHFALQADKILALKDGEMQVYGTMAELEGKGFDSTQLLRLMKKEDGPSDQDDVDGFNQDETELSDSPVSPTDPLPRTNSNSAPANEPHDVDTTSIYTAPSISLNSAVEFVTSHREDGEVQTFGPPQEEKAHGRITIKTYYRYFKAGGSFLTLAVLIVVFIFATTGVVIADWWLADWARCAPFQQAQNTTLSTATMCLNCSNETVPSTCLLSVNQRIGVYGGLVTVAVFMGFVRVVLLCILCVNASRVLHNRMFASILRAPIRFFDTNPIGRVLNRFSKDVGFLDDLLPFIFVQYTVLLLRCLAIIITAAAANPYIVIAAVFLIVAFLSVRWYYLKTSRDVKRLEAISRSPLYSHISATLQGLPTIRSLGKQEAVMDLFHKFHNQHTQGWYLYLASAEWFSIRIDTLSGLFLAAVAFGTIPLASELNAGVVGLALAYTVSLAGRLQYTVRLSAEIENLMISAERVMDYSHLNSEPALDTLPPNEKPPANWPDKGQITMDNVRFQYSSDLPLVLKDLTFSVQPAEKIGIVGRTGAGKSSLLSVLFRLAEPFGSITIDGLETKSLGLHDLRKKISIIPQDPVLFSGTMRYNLDPFDDYSVTELWDVLEQVQLKEAVEQLEGRLEGEVSEGGSNFSVGQRQLVCLARALLRKNKILILDEATANVDVRTDSIIQAALGERFADCTVLTVAHRLNTIMDSDKVLVMNKGQLKEFESPHRLLQDPSSQFSKMVDKTGPAASQKLRAMAQEAHLRRRGGGGGSSTRKNNESDAVLLLQTPV